MKWILIGIGALAAVVALTALAGAMVPREHRATSAVTIRQPPETLWAAVSDLGGVTAWWGEMTSSERLPDEAGKPRWRQKVGGFDMSLEVVESSPPARMVTRILSPEGAAFGGRWIYELTPVEGGTRVSVTEDGWIANVIFRAMSRFVFGYYGSLDSYLEALGKKFGEDVMPEHVTG